MAGKNTAVYGLYRDRPSVENAVDALRNAGFSVHSDNTDWTKRAKEILRSTGAEDVSSAGEASADYAETDKPMPR